MKTARGTRFLNRRKRTGREGNMAKYLPVQNSNPVQVAVEDIARGWRVESVTTNAAVSRGNRVSNCKFQVKFTVADPVAP